MNRIAIIHRVAEKLRNGEWDVEDRTIYSGPLTARGVAKAKRVLDGERADYRHLFGPGTISPKHTFRLQIDGVDADELNLYREDGETWGQVAARLAP